MRVLLASGGVKAVPGALDLLKAECDRFYGPVAKVHLIAFANHDGPSVVDTIVEKKIFGDRETVLLTEASQIPDAKAFFTWGGNTFRLLKALQDRKILAPLRAAVGTGIPYGGVSAGSVIAGPTIKTTNDMPIVAPQGFDALGLVPFQVNPHFMPGTIFRNDGEAYIKHGGETRIDRLREFHQENETPVVGIQEGSILERQGSTLRFARPAGVGPAFIFYRGQEPRSVDENFEWSTLLK